MAQTKAGRPAHPAPENITLQRLQELANLAGDPRCISQVFILRHFNKLTDAQFYAAELIGRIYRDFERMHGRNRSCMGISYEMGRGGSGREASDEEALAVETEWNKLLDCIPIIPREARSNIELLCVENRAVPSSFLPEIKIILDRVAVEFDLGPAPPIVPGLPPTRKRAPSRTERLVSGVYAFCPPDAVPRHEPDSDEHAATVRRIEENARRMAELRGAA